MTLPLRFARCLILLAPVALAAAEPVRVPLPFLADQATVFSSMVVEVSRQSYDAVGLEDAASGPAAPEVAAFFNLVEALGTRDAEQVMELVRLSPNENPQDRLKLVAGYQQAFAGKWDGLRLLARYDLAQDQSSYIWSVPADGGSFVRSFRLAGREGGFRWLDSTVQLPVRRVETLLVQAEQLRASGVAYPLPASDYRYGYPLHQAGVTLLFNGTVLRWDAFAAEHPDLPAAAMYHRAMRAFRERDLEGFAAFFTPYSAQRFLDWARAMPSAEFDAYHASVMAGREVRFILDADPLYVIFYNTPETLRHDLVIREGSAYRITSFYIESFLDDLLLDRALFVEPVLADVVAAGLDDIAYVNPSAPAGPPAPVASAAPPPAPAAAPLPDAPPAQAGAESPTESCPASGCTTCWLVIAGAAIALLALLFLVIIRNFRKP